MSNATKRWGRAGIASLATTALVASGLTAFAGAASASEPVDFERVAGENRYETSVEAAEAFGPTTNALLASGEQGHYVDALSGNFLAGVRTAPILLTREDRLPEPVKAHLESSTIDTITILGGELAVSAAVEAELEAMDITVNRLEGRNRYLTNQEIIEAGAAEAADTALIATGENFPDALGAGPVSYAGKMPVGLTKLNDIPDFVVDELKAAGVTEALVLGGELAVSDEVIEELESKGIDVLRRLEGRNRSLTSIEVANWAIANMDFSESEVDFASGRELSEGIDALSGGPVSGKEGVPILITVNEFRAPQLVDYLEANCQRIDEGDIYGGPLAITEALEQELEAAAQCAAPASATSRPELVSAEVVDTNTAGELGTNGTTVRYTFDENIANAGGLQPTAANFLVYNTAGFVDAGDAIVEVSGATVTVRFNVVDTDAAAAALTVATVDPGAVNDGGGVTNPEGDAALGATTGGGTINLPAGITEAPDFTSVGGFNSNLATANATQVEFRFDEDAVVSDDTGFNLILLNGDEVASTAVTGGEGTSTLIVEFTGEFSAADVARATVDPAAVTEETDNDNDSTLDANVLQAVDVSGASVTPDLVSVEFRPDSDGVGGTPDRAVFTFDENVATATATNFFLYKEDGSTVAGVSLVQAPSGNQVAVNFTDTAINDAVGGFVVDGAVTASDNTAPNQQDEAGVANTTSESGRTAGRTAGPDLTAVALATDTDFFGNVTGVDATYTFDEPVNAADRTKFFLYLSDGTKLAADACTVDGAGTSTTDDDTNVVCDFEGATAATLDEAIDATLGTVQDGAVTAVDGAPSNPEGAEFTTGGTGTPTA